MTDSKSDTAPFTLDGDTLPAHLQGPVKPASSAPKQGMLFAAYHDRQASKAARCAAPTLMDWLSDNP